MDIDFAKAVAMLSSARDSKPKGFCYTPPGTTASCKYAHRDEKGELTIAGCLIGTAFLAEGIITFDELKMSNHASKGFLNNDVNSGDLIRFLYGKGYRFTHKARLFIGSAQALQDNGKSWADAIDKAMHTSNEFSYADTFSE